MSEITNRRVKLQSRYRSGSGNGKVVPWLTLSGVWLARLGFNAGDMLRLTVREKLLIIEPLGDEAQAAHDYKTALQEVKQALKKLGA
ncbi:type I addiction module toxin, SymE family [Elizabethkingia argentiflava]|uniref:Type I addiction module toxin, SymE family n=1 Tax=Elizabethkingia argenteiflava TaxID=2681556 RepID=A0A845PQI2_9FLAO|nr:SymE family type I addiction module toxin [Elizabethkingia argenteiflava]NAW50094.1 type I addiction module toxin, SymE family [Elizabethkingia argenteiflava]